MTLRSASQVASKSIVLIGGSTTMDDGSTLDSRQPIEGDAASQVMLRSLATSRLWWNIGSSLVTPILDAAGPEAFALILGPRSVVEVDSAGELKRTRLRGVLRGGVGSVSVILADIGINGLPKGYDGAAVLRPGGGEIPSVIGVKVGEPGPRWRFAEGIPGGAYLEHTAEKIGATAVINTEPSMRGPIDLDLAGSAPFETFEKEYLVLNRAVLVLPHTLAIDGWLRSYVDWIRSGRPSTPATFLEVEAWDTQAPPDPLSYAHPVPTRAHFEVTGLIQDGEWRDPSDLEAARSLLQARYDLKIGIWDLAGNPVLRSALLAEKESAAPPKEAAPVPPAAAERADAVVRAKLAERALIRSIVNTLKPMGAVGWHDGREPYPYEQLYLPLVEGLEKASPSLWLTLTINKRQTTVSLPLHSQPRDIALAARVKEMEPELRLAVGDASIDLDSGWPTLWKAKGGWGDDVDWTARAHELASCTSRWMKLFEGLADEYRLVRRRGWPRRPDS